MIRRLAAVAALACLAGGAPAQPSRHIITDAVFQGPTDRYPHAVLGDALEWGALIVTVTGPAATDGTTRTLRHRITLPPSQVFEDLAPRLWDITGDGAPEVVVVRSGAQTGAALVIYALDTDGVPAQLVATPPIGTRFRWLAPIGAADMDGDGHIEIGYIDRPHLARTLRVWEFRDGALRPEAAVTGLTNHRIGEDFISGGLRTCHGRAEFVTADANWTAVIATRLERGQLLSRRLADFAGPRSFDRALRCASDP